MRGNRNRIEHSEPGLLSMVSAGEVCGRVAILLHAGTGTGLVGQRCYFVIGKVTEKKKPNQSRHLMERLSGGRIAVDGEINDAEGKTLEEIAEIMTDMEAKAQVGSWRL